MGRRQEPCGPVPTAEARTANTRTAKAGFAEVVLVCGKCAKRQGVDRKRLGRALERAAGRAGSEVALRPKARRKDHKVKVVETGCLGPCPKRMLTIATAASLARGRVVLLDPALDVLSPESLSLDTPALSYQAARNMTDGPVPCVRRTPAAAQSRGQSAMMHDHRRLVSTSAAPDADG